MKKKFKIRKIVQLMKKKLNKKVKFKMNQSPNPIFMNMNMTISSKQKINHIEN